MKRNLLLALITFSFCFVAKAQQNGYPMPSDANRFPYEHGIGNPQSAIVAVALNTYSGAVKFTPNATALNLNRVYRTVCVYNPSATRTVFACMGSAGVCLDSSEMVVPPTLGLCLDGVRFGTPVGRPDVYIRLDAAGAVNVQVNGT